jgi:hypothetical protein
VKTSAEAGARRMAVAMAAAAKSSTCRYAIKYMAILSCSLQIELCAVPIWLAG